MLELVRAQALALTTEAWNAALCLKQKKRRTSWRPLEEETPLLVAAAEKAICKRLLKRHRQEDRNMPSNKAAYKRRKTAKLLMTEDLSSCTQSPWRVRGVRGNIPVTSCVWKQLHSWALLQLSQMAGVEYYVLSAFRSAYATANPPLNYSAWLAVEAIARLKYSIHRWDRSDGPALSLILLKSAGDAMMKKTDTYDPKRPVAQKTRESRAAVHGTPGCATALLPERIEVLRRTDERFDASSVHSHAQHLLASSIMESCTAFPSSDPASTFRECMSAASLMMDDAHKCAVTLAKLYAEPGNYDFDGNYISSKDMQPSYIERLLSTVSSASESLLRSRAELRAAVALLCGSRVMKEGAAQLPKATTRPRVASVSFAGAKGELSSECSISHVVEHCLSAYTTSTPEEASMQLYQSGALIGESIWFGDKEYVPLDQPIMYCQSACEQRGVKQLSLVPGTPANCAEMRHLGQLCNCLSPQECACNVVQLHDKRGETAVDWRTANLPRLVDCAWRPYAGTDYLNLESSSPTVSALNRIARSIRNGTNASTVRRACEGFSLLSHTDRLECENVILKAVIRSLENEIYNNCCLILRKWTNMNPSVVKDYWRAEQSHFCAGSGISPPPGLALPAEFVSIVDEIPCPRQGCCGTLQEDERFVRSLDEASKAVLCCSQRGCGIVIDK